jgi:hypothetical protein
MPKFKSLLLSILLAVPALVFAQNEQLVITTYYPSPNGSYDEIGVNKLAVNVSGTQAAGAGTAADPSNVVAVPSEYADMRNGDAHIGWSMIIGAGNASGWAYDEMSSAGEIMPDDGDLLVKGEVGIGTRRNVAIAANQPHAKLEVMNNLGAFPDLPQLRLTDTFDPADANNNRHVDFQVNADSDLTVTPATTGSVIFRPTTNSEEFFQIFRQAGTTPLLNISTNDNGRIGINTITPEARIHVYNNSAQAGAGLVLLDEVDGGSDVGVNLRIINSANNWARGFRIQQQVGTDFSTRAVFGVLGASGAGNPYYAYIGGAGNPDTLGNPYYYPWIIFRERTTANPAGTVGIGYGGSAAHPHPYTGTDANFCIAPTLTARADAWVDRSSRTLKKDIAPLDNAMNKILNLQGVSFKWKSNDKKSIGLIAEDVARVVPEVVDFGKSGKDPGGIAYGHLSALLVEAMKEQQEEISALREEIKKLKKSAAR